MTTPFPSKVAAAFKTTALVVTMAGLTATQATAQSADAPITQDELLQRAQFLEDIGAAERINFAGKLRMLSQRIPAAACNVYGEIDPTSSEPVLHAAIAEFDKILAALEVGDEDLGIVGVETRRKTLAAIEALRSHWLPVEEVVTEIENHQTTLEHVQFMADENMNILADAKLLVSEISGQYADPTALVQADALRIDIAGRQRMLTQKISKEVCFINAGINAEASLEVLGGTVNMFEVSLSALLNGMPEAGIGPAPTEEIEAQLTAVLNDWNAVKPHIDVVLAGGALDDAVRAEVFGGLNKTMGDMNVAVGMFAEESKLGL